MLFLNGSGFISTVVTGQVHMLYVSTKGSGERIATRCCAGGSLSGDSTVPRQGIGGIGQRMQVLPAQCLIQEG